MLLQPQNCGGVNSQYLPYGEGREAGLTSLLSPLSVEQRLAVFSRCKYEQPGSDTMWAWWLL